MSTVSQPDLHLSPAALRSYALGELHGEAVRQAEAHLNSCHRCRAGVLALRAELVLLVEALPPAGALPSMRSSAPVARPRSWGPLRPVFAAALLALWVLGLGWGWNQHAQLATLRAEQARVTGWLAQPQMTILTLQNKARQPAGQVLLLPSREVLFMLPKPAAGKVYQVWVAAHWKRGDLLTPTEVSTSGTFSASVGDNDYVCVSLEDRPAQPGQTRPTRLVGWTKV